MAWISTGYRLAMVRAGVAAMCGVALTAGLLSVGAATQTAIEDTLLGGGDQIRVRPPTRIVGPIDLSGTLLPERRMSAATLAGFAELSGVAQVWPEAWSRFPVTLYGDLLGASMRSDAALLGVVEAGVAQDLNQAWTWQPGERVPVLAPRSILAVFNSSFAPANGLPKLSDTAMIGRTFRLRAGYSAIGRSLDQELSLEAEIVGVTAYGGNLAAIVPIEVIAWVDAQLDIANPGAHSRAVLVLAPNADAAQVQAEVRALGWAVDDVGGGARQIAQALGAMDLLVMLVGGVLVLATLLVMAQIYGVLLRQRGRDIAVLRGLGTKPGWIISALMTEVTLAASFAVLAGLALGAQLGALASAALSEQMSTLLGTPITLDPTLSWTWIAVFSLGVPFTTMLATAPAILRALADGQLKGHA